MKPFIHKLITAARRLSVTTNLYAMDLNKFQLLNEKKIPHFALKILTNINDISNLQLVIEERGAEYKKILEERLSSKKFICFSFMDDLNNNVAYTRWLRTDSFTHERYKKRIDLKEGEAFTLDSYTCNNYRGKGLHKEMNIRMLNYCKSELKLQTIYMVILEGPEYVHLHKTVKELGYAKVKSNKSFDFRIITNLLQKKRAKDV